MGTIWDSDFSTNSISIRRRRRQRRRRRRYGIRTFRLISSLDSAIRIRIRIRIPTTIWDSDFSTNFISIRDTSSYKSDVRFEEILTIFFLEKTLENSGSRLRRKFQKFKFVLEFEKKD